MPLLLRDIILYGYNIFIASNLWEYHKYFGECMILDWLLICSSLHEICSVTGFSKAFLGNDIANFGSTCFSETYDLCVCTHTRMYVYVCVFLCLHAHTGMCMCICVLGNESWCEGMHTCQPHVIPFPPVTLIQDISLAWRSQSRVGSLSVSARGPLVFASQH